MNNNTKVGLMTYREYQKKISCIRILFKTIYRRKNPYWKAEYLKEKDLFDNIGRGCYMACSLPDEPFLISMGSNVSIATGTRLITHDVFGDVLNNTDGQTYRFPRAFYGTIEIGDNVAIGGNAIIMPNVKIGSGSIVAGGSVVTKNVESNTVVGGNPAKVICSTQEFMERRKLKKLKQWSWDDCINDMTEFYWEN